MQSLGEPGCSAWSSLEGVTGRAGCGLRAEGVHDPHRTGHPGRGFGIQGRSEESRQELGEKGAASRMSRWYPGE